MSARDDAIRCWDDFIRDRLRHRAERPPPLEDWFCSYRGKVTEEAMPEPYIGSWYAPKMVILGLNPGQADLDFQGRDGHFAKDIKRLRSFSAWAATDPYGSSAWEATHGSNLYRRQRWTFAKRWTGKPVRGEDLLIVELYPWHSKNVTATMTPPKDVLDRFVWAPLAETGVPLIFAFGARWAKMCSRLGLACEDRWGKDGQDLGSPVASRVVETYRVNDRQRVVVSWQSGYAGPPGSEDVERVRDRLAGR